MQSLSKLAGALISAALLTVAGCGGGSASTQPETPSITLSGIAATGAAFVDAVITVIDSTGTVVGTSAPVGSDGTYTVTLAASAKAPFVLVASRTDANGDTQNLVSVVDSATQTTANVTPITTLIASRLSSSGDPTKLDEELAAGTVEITPQAVADTVAEVKAILAPLLAATGTESADPLKDSFSTDGTGYDRLLDSISITIIPSSATETNIEVAVKQQLSDDEQPVAISFSSGSTEPPALPTIDESKLPSEGLSVKISDFLSRLTACYAVPFEDRVEGASSGVNAVTGTAADIKAPACRQAFFQGYPTNFLSNGVSVGRDSNNNGAFASLFRRGATGVVFSQGSYEFTRANGDIVIGYKSRATDGSETYDTFVLRDGGADGLQLIGNLYRFGGGVSAYHQRRNFITLNQSAYDYYSTGYSLNVPNDSRIARVEVTSPNQRKMVLKPEGNLDYMALVKGFGTPAEKVTRTSVVRLRSEFLNAVAGGHPRDVETTNLFFALTDWTEDELANSKAGGTWKFEYYLSEDDPSTVSDETTVPVVQYYKNRARALTIAELRTQGLATLDPRLVSDIGSGAQPDGQSGAGQIVFEANEMAGIGTANGGPGWAVAEGQLPPTNITLFGSMSGIPFNDRVGVKSTDRRALVPCVQQGPKDVHCHVNGDGSFGPGFAEGARLDGLHLFARDSGGREFANFYAMYKLNLIP